MSYHSFSRIFKRRYQDQRWLIYDEQRKFGLYYDLREIHEVSLEASDVDRI